MRITSYSIQKVTIEGTEAEMVALQKMVSGLGYVACGREGMPLFAERYENVHPLPDPLLLTHFTPAPSTVAKYTHENGIDPKAVADLERNNGFGISLYVEHLCGYHYTPENYARSAARMHELGFVCMRSPRGGDGRYWEAWYLPGLWAGKGRLKACKSIEQAINIIIGEVRPGSISAVQQRMALSID